VALKKPSDLFNKKESSVVFQTSEISSNITETYDRFRDNLDKVNTLSEQIEQLSQQLSEKMTRTDLENAMYSQLIILDENFKSIQNQVKGLNKEDLKEFKVNISNLTEIVGNLVENELPKYKKQITKNEVRIGDKFEELKEVVEENIIGIKEEIDNKVNDIAEVIGNNLEYFNNQLQETSVEVKKTTDTYNKLSKIVESKVSKENDKLEEYSQVIQSLHEAFVELEESLQKETSTYNQIIEEKFATISSGVKNTIDNIDEDVDTFKNQVSSDISSIKADVVIFEKHNKDTEKTIQEFSEQLYKISEIDESIGELNEDIGKLQNQYDSISNQSIETKKDLEVVERYIQNHHQELVELKEEVFGEIEKLPVGNLQENLERLEKKIDYIKETYSKIEPEVIVKEVIKEGLLNEPPNTKNSDPLTPLDQKFVTLDQLQEHYRLFINRIQQQLSTIGGGGETRLKYLDDIVGIATNASVYDGKYLKYNHSLGKFEFTGDITLGTSGINSITSTTAAPSWYYTNKSIPSGDTSPQGVYVGAAGTTMFVVGNTNDRISQYPLSVAYDVSTAGAATTSFLTTSQESVPTGIDFHPNGTKMFVIGQTSANLTPAGDYVHEYSLSTPWNVAPSSVGYTTSHNVSAQEATPTGVVIGAAGTVMYVVGNTSNTVFQYTLTTPYSLAAGNVTYASKTLVLSSAPLSESAPQDISFNSTGTVLWVVGSTNDRIYEFRLGTAWDISTAVFYDDVYVGFNETSPLGLHVIPEQNVAYVCGSASSSDRVFQYSTNTPAIEISSSGISTESSIILSNETRVKDRLYVKGDILTQGTLTVTGATTLNTTTTISAGTLTVSSGTITAGNVAATLLSGNTTTNITLASGQTSGTLIVGGASQTGTITIDQSASGHILNIATGANASGVGKTVNIATGGASGSRTLITVGSATAGAASTVFIPSPTNLGIGITNPTSPLHVVGTALITGITTVGLGSTSTPPSNSQMSFELISDTNLRIKVRGSDGVLRSANITLA
jgi:hypothetical protein